MLIRKCQSKTRAVKKVGSPYKFVPLRYNLPRFTMYVATIFLEGITLALSHCVLVFFTERLLTATHWPAFRRYRLAFLFGSVFALTFWYSSLFAIPFFWGAFAGIGGAFLGGLAATWRVSPLWENNYPPSAKIQQRVLKIHQNTIGKGMPTPKSKRLFDLILASFLMLILSPVYTIIAFLIWFEDPGAILFVKNSVGKGGVNFHQYKFRTMVQRAEEATGPILASIQDLRVLKVGRWLRKSHLDELPQLVNILKGEMSFVGPRPQRTVLVYKYLQKTPEYAERHLILPGIAGLAQIAGSYYLTPHQKLRFDRLYIQNISLGFDLKLLCLAFLIAFWYRWKKNWDGRLPRWMLH